MKRISLPLMVTLILVSCGKPSVSSLTEQALVGSWTLTELQTQKGHRGPAAGILAGEMRLDSGGNWSGRLQWTKEATGKDQPVMSFSGSWSLTNDVLICRMSTDAPPVRSRVWFDGKLLALEPEGKATMIYYYSKH